MKKTLTTLLLSLCLCAQLNFCSAANSNYDEEITLPIGTNFDLDMPEVTRYEYDGAYVKAITVNNKEQFILQKLGDTIINVIMDENGQKTELKVLVHIVSEQQFNDPNAAKATAQPAAPVAPTTKPASNATQPAATTTTTPAPTTAKPATTTAPTTTTSKPVVSTTPTPTTNSKPVVSTTPTPATTSKPVVSTTPTPAPTSKPATATTTVPQVTTPAAQPVAPAATTPATADISSAQAITRPTAQPQNSAEAAKYKAEQYAFDVLDLVNAERDKYKLPHLTMVKDLEEAAAIRAREVATRFSHTRPDNTKFVTVMTNPGTMQGENFAAGQVSPAAVVKAWMSSPNHMNNILSPVFKQMGVGYYETTTGTYPCYWVQLFRG